jgi:hypothetical protein
MQQSKRNVSGMQDTSVSAEDTMRMRLATIRRVIHAAGFVKLPYWIAFAQEPKYKVSGEDRQVLYSEYLYGVLPDTSLYYGFIEGVVGDVVSARLAVFDKSGNRIASGYFLENNCIHMVEEDIYCDEYITIGEDLSLDYYYKSKYVWVDMEYEGQRDTVCVHYEKKGKIHTDGTIVFEEGQKYPCIE